MVFLHYFLVLWDQCLSIFLFISGVRLSPVFGADGTLIIIVSFSVSVTINFDCLPFSLMQQLSHELEQNENKSFRHPVGSPIASSPPGATC